MGPLGQGGRGHGFHYIQQVGMLVIGVLYLTLCALGGYFLYQFGTLLIATFGHVARDEVYVTQGFKVGERVCYTNAIEK